MAAKEFDFELIRGDTTPVKFDLCDYNGNPIDLTNAEVYFTIKKSPNTSEVILQKKKSTGDITFSGITGVLTLNHDDTSELSYGTYRYDIQIKSGSYVKTLVMGNIELTSEITWKSNE